MSENSPELVTLRAIGISLDRLVKIARGAELHELANRLETARLASEQAEAQLSGEKLH